MKFVRSFLGAALLLFVLESCYRMPTDDDFSVVPTTNNPALTNERSDHFVPGMSY